MTRRRMPPFLGLAALAISVLAAGCMSFSVAGGSTSTETGDKIALTGRVTNGGIPVPGILVSLVKAGLHDTTDATGTYVLSGTPAPGASVSNASPDTLVFSREEQAITRLVVSSWSEQPPELRIVQRGFSGTFTDSASGIARIEGVVTGEIIAPGDSVAATFFHNVVAGNYSGFIWFPAPGWVQDFAIHVNVYDSTGALTGRSITVPFTSNAGNITVPAFHSRNLADDATP